MPAGRPTKYSQEMIEKAHKFFAEYEPFYENPVEKQDKDGNVTTKMERIPNPPPTLEKLADYLKINRTTVWDWSEQPEKEEFSNAIKKGMRRAFERCVNANAYTGGYQAAFTIFACKNKLGWTDRREIDSKVKVEIEGLDKILAKVYPDEA